MRHQDVFFSNVTQMADIFPYLLKLVEELVYGDRKAERATAHASLRAVSDIFIALILASNHYRTQNPLHYKASNLVLKCLPLSSINYFSRGPIRTRSALVV